MNIAGEQYKLLLRQEAQNHSSTILDEALKAAWIQKGAVIGRLIVVAIFTLGLLKL